MVPHIVFDPAADGYFPGPSGGQCAQLQRGRAAQAVATSGICQPPVHAIAAARILAVAGGGADALAETRPGCRAVPEAARLAPLPRAVAADPAIGLITVFHGWESGMDNSPRWDVPYSNVLPGPGLPGTPGATPPTCPRLASGRPTASTTATCG